MYRLNTPYHTPANQSTRPPCPLCSQLNTKTDMTSVKTSPNQNQFPNCTTQVRRHVPNWCPAATTERAKRTYIPRGSAKMVPWLDNPDSEGYIKVCWQTATSMNAQHGYVSENIE
ncbi:hypothetical protein EYC84_008337 [Monilinia fructicola]|uniref:Uncharacterized protein n=1 Tax=Monilinia fructicola TaxID=38448 RepID=A0A5M9JGV5_MONFR|nr:hypothetical protein EYC84_008337 [Monilinia fructicola]